MAQRGVEDQVAQQLVIDAVVQLGHPVAATLVLNASPTRRSALSFSVVSGVTFQSTSAPNDAPDVSAKLTSV